MNSLFDLLLFLVDKYDHIIDKDTLRIQFESDPAKNFQALSNTCDYFGIENLSLILPINTFEKLPDYFIAEIKNERHQRLLLIDKSNTHALQYSKDGRKFHDISKKDFLKEWSGVVFAIEKSTEKRSMVGKMFDNKELFVFLITLALFIIMTVTNGSQMAGVDGVELLSGKFAYGDIIIIISLITGFLASLQLIKQKYGGQSNSYICRLGKSSDCDQVINSKQAKLFGKVELTDVCFAVFGSFLISFVITSNWSLIQLLSIAGLMILPYSIYVQAFVLKKWCPLCLIVGGSLLGLAVSGFWNPVLNSFSTTSIIGLAIGAFMSLIFLSLLKELFKNRGQLFQHKLQYKTLWRSHDVVSKLLDSFQPVELDLDPEKVNLTIVTNPLCPACKRLHDKIKLLEEEFHDKITISYKFLVSAENRERPAVKISATILNLSVENQKAAIDEWYDATDRKSWYKKWEEKSVESEKGVSQLQKQLDWAYANNINYSPALIIDEKLIPSDYSIEQYKDLIKVFQDKRSSQDDKNTAQQNSFLQDDGQLGVALS